MAKPRPVIFDVPGHKFSLKFYALPEIASITEFFPSGFPLASWPDLLKLKEKMAKTATDKNFADIDAIIKVLSEKGNPSSIEAVALPLALSGLNLDLSTLNSRGVANLVATTAVASVQADTAKPQVLLIAQSSDFIDLLKSSVASLAAAASKKVSVGGMGDAAAHIVIGTTADLPKAAVDELKLVVLMEIDQICAFKQDEAAKEMLTKLRSGDKKRQFIVFNPELLMSETDSMALKIRNVQDAATGKTGFVAGQDGKELVEFVKKSGVTVNTYQLASIGAYDMPSLRNTDPQVLISTFGADLSQKMAAELERWERSNNDGSVPPFDMASGQWEWTPDTLENWVAKGLDKKYYHEEPDGSHWILCSASHALFSKSAAAPAPWELDPGLTPGGVDDYDDADAAWAEMYGDQSQGGFDMGGMQQQLDYSTLPPELQMLLGRVEQTSGPMNLPILADAFRRAGIRGLQDLRNMRWTMTQSLGIDYGLAAEINGALDTL
mmetsp:Transcript_45800/g.107493  ORF Transcript_45800/g.107493 Transcript_45800/m.107493 type:complete len:494 (-) Transcript_45800:345-1826(-)